MFGLLSKKFRHTTILAVLCVGVLAGLLLGRGGGVGVGFAAFATLLFVVTLPRKRFAAVITAGLLGLSLGMLRGAQFSHSLEPYERLYGSAVVLEVTAGADAVYAQNGQLEFDAGNVQVIEPLEERLPGTVRIQGYGTNAVSRGDRLRVSGKLFPTGGSRQAKVSYAQLQTISTDKSVIETIRKEFVAGMFSAVPEPEASFGLGLLIGQRTTLPDSLNDQLAVAGLTHIIAVSGYNLTIIVRVVRRLLGRRSKYQSTAIAFGLIIVFVLITGFSASIVRAAVVSTLSLLARYYGRTIKPLLLLLFAAALTAVWSPIYIWSDIGWYLSFLAFFGVLILAPLLRQRLYGDKTQKLLGQVVLESVCAQLMAAPLILYIFGEVSLVALLSNAVIVPMVPLAMLFSLMAGVAGMLVPVLAGIFALPATAVLTYMLDLVVLFARVPGALLQTHVTFANTIYVYVLLLAAAVVLHTALKRRDAKVEIRNIIE